jgi:oligoendopeptidase F
MKDIIMKKKLSIILFVLMLCAPGIAQKLTSGLLERSEIDEKYKWDLKDVYVNEQAWEKDFNWVKQNLSQYKDYAGRLNRSSAALLQCLKFNDKLDNKLNWIRVYVKMNRDVDMNSEKYNNMWSRYSSLESEVNLARSFIHTEILSMPEKTIQKFISESKGLQVYKHFLNKLLLRKKHILPADKEEILAKIFKLIDNPYSVFGKLVYAELPFPTIKDDKGEDILLNRSTSWRARSSPDRTYRKNGYESYYGTLKMFKGTLAQNLSNYIDGKILNARVRGYNSALEASFDKFNLPVKVYDTLIETVRNNLQPFHRWMKIKKNVLEYDTLYIYDTRASMFSTTEKEYSWEEARDLVFESLKLLGDSYVNDIREAYDKHWIDAFPNIGKETGGYSTGPCGPHPYVKMNWGGKIFDFTTLVHELGHYVHAYKTMRKQPYVYYNYPPFLGEIASTAAENASWLYLIDKSDTPAEKLYQIEQFIDIVCMYFYTAAMNAEFEKILYHTVEEGGSLSAQSISKFYKDLTKTYYGEAITLTEFDTYVWAEWPHFYLDYYIYSYATSFAASIQLCENIRREGEPAIDRFIQFLEAGGSDYPVDILKKAGVDLTSPAPIKAMANRLNQLMDEVEKLIKAN